MGSKYTFGSHQPNLLIRVLGSRKKVYNIVMGGHSIRGLNGNEKNRIENNFFKETILKRLHPE